MADNDRFMRNCFERLHRLASQYLEQRSFYVAYVGGSFGEKGAARLAKSCRVFRKDFADRVFRGIGPLSNEAFQFRLQLWIAEDLQLGRKDIADSFAEFICGGLAIGFEFETRLPCCIYEPLPLAFVFTDGDQATSYAVALAIKHERSSNRDTRRYRDALQFQHAEMIYLVW